MQREMFNERLSISALVSAIRSFLFWWRKELLSLLPQGLREHFQFNEHQLLIALNDSALQCVDCRNGQSEFTLSLNPDGNGMLNKDEADALLRLKKRAGAGVVILLPDNHVLTFTFPLPMEAEKSLDEVVGYELGRHAPFRLEQVYYDYEVIERLRDEKKLSVMASVVPKNQLSSTLAMIREWGLAPTAITTGAGGERKGGICQVSSLNLLPPAERSNAGKTINTVSRLLTASALLLVIVATVQPIFMQELRIHELEQKIAAVKKEAVNVQSMRQELERAAEASAYVAEQKHLHPEVLDILNVLTTLLPDDTWLERFEMKGNRIRIQGMSEDASSLIELLENDPLLTKVSFDSPVVNDPKTERFRFQIVAEVISREAG